MAIDVVWVTAQKSTGVTIQADQLAKELNQTRGFSVDLMSAEPLDTAHSSPFIRDEEGTIYPVGSVVRALEELDPDIIMLHHLSGEVLQAIDLLKEMAVIVTRLGVNLRELMLTDAQKMDRVGDFTKVFQMSDLLVSSSPRTTEDLVTMGISEDRIVHIPTAIKMPDHELPEIEPEPENAVGTIGRLGRVKNQFTVVQAVSMLRDIKPRISPEYHLAGKPNDRSWQGVEAFSKQVAPSVSMNSMGWVEQPMEDFYPKIDIHLHPSWTENCPVNVLEAALCGVPSIVSDLGWQRAFPEISFPTAEPDDAKSWASKIHFYLMDDYHRMDVAEQQRKAVVEHYTMDSAVDKYEKCLTRAFNEYDTFKLQDVSGLRRGVGR